MGGAMGPPLSQAQTLGRHRDLAGLSGQSLSGQSLSGQSLSGQSLSGVRRPDLSGYNWPSHPQ
jgi:uncharacterized protein YjbI with pentapeptide repeats